MLIKQMVGQKPKIKLCHLSCQNCVNCLDCFSISSPYIVSPHFSPFFVLVTTLELPVVLFLLVKEIFQRILLSFLVTLKLKVPLGCLKDSFLVKVV